MGNELIYQTLSQFKVWLKEFIAYIDMYIKSQEETQSNPINIDIFALFSNTHRSFLFLEKRITVIWFTPLFFWAPTYATNKPINAARLKLFSDHAREV